MPYKVDSYDIKLLPGLFHLVCYLQSMYAKERKTNRQIGLYLPFDYYKQCCYEHDYINIYLRISLGKIISTRFLIIIISLAWIYSTLEKGRLMILYTFCKDTNWDRVHLDFLRSPQLVNSLISSGGRLAPGSGIQHT